MRRQRSLAQMLLVWQLLIVFLLLASFTAFAVVVSNQSFRTTEGRRMLSAAEDLAATGGVSVSLTDPLRWRALTVFAETAQNLSGTDRVVIADSSGVVRGSPEPDERGQRLDLGGSTVLTGHAWVGEVPRHGVRSIEAHVPVVSKEARMIGIVVVGRDAPDFLRGVQEAPQNMVTLLALATFLGIAGSILLARRVKQQTLGLEPQEITRLVEHREAMLRGIREGVLGVDQQNRITVVNDQARELLSLPADCVGRDIDSLDLNDRARDVLTGRTGGVDQIVLRRGRVVVLNRMPISTVGAVITMRDRTELVDLRRELAAHRTTTDTLRAQAHEFTNRLHTISGLIELGEYDELARFVDRVSHTHAQWRSEVGARIADPATAALLVAKASLAAERGVGLRLGEDSALGEVDEQLSADLTTVLGNLVDNALDAVEGVRQNRIEVDLRDTGGTVTVVVRDSGPGVAPDIVEEVFRHGFTTKAARGGERGLGLALTRQICRRRGGTVEVRNEHGAVFTARLPATPEVPA